MNESNYFWKSRKYIQYMYQINHYIFLLQIVIIGQISLTLLVIDWYLLQKKYQTCLHCSLHLIFTPQKLFKAFYGSWQSKDSVFFCCTTHCICHDTLAKVLVTFYQRLRNEFKQFPAKNQSQASNWLTCWIGQSEVQFLANMSHYHPVLYGINSWRRRLKKSKEITLFNH